MREFKVFLMIGNLKVQWQRNTDKLATLSLLILGIILDVA